MSVKDNSRWSIFKNVNYKFISYYVVLSVIWLGSAIYTGQLILNYPLWFALVVTFVLGLPLFLAATYAVTIQKIHRSSQFFKMGILFWFLNRRVLAYLWWLVWTIVFTFLLLLYVGASGRYEWIAFFLAIPVFAVVHIIFLSIAVKEFKPYIAVHKSLAWSRWSTTIGMAVMYVILITVVGENHTFASLPEAIQFAHQRMGGTSSSILIQETSGLISFFMGVKIFALGNVYLFNGTAYVALIIIGSLMIFYNITFVLSGFMVPVGEYRRVLGRLQDTDNPPTIPTRSWAISSALITIFIGFIYLPATVYLDYWLRINPQIVKSLHQSQEITIETVELIGSDYYKPGTVLQIEQAYFASINELDVSINELRKASKAGFQLMAENVDDYLDWYYSLPAEYQRIMALASGSVEEWMTKNLQTFLMKGNAFGNVQQTIEIAYQKNEQLKVEYLEKVEQILAENYMQPITAQPQIVHHGSLAALQEPPSHTVLVNMESRMLISGGVGTAGAITGAIAGKVTAKVAAKGAIKLAAQALIKVTAGKAVSLLGGSAAGAASGAALGSVVPGAGTAVGAAVGGIVGGLTVGLTVEKLLLMLEESYSREEFKQQILEAIHDEETEFQMILDTKTDSSISLQY